MIWFSDRVEVKLWVRVFIQTDVTAALHNVYLMNLTFSVGRLYSVSCWTATTDVSQATYSTHTHYTHITHTLHAYITQTLHTHHTHTLHTYIFDSHIHYTHTHCTHTLHTYISHIHIQHTHTSHTYIK